jgi:hypothetical protein
MIRAEWTKFRTVRGWVAGVGAAVLAVVLLGVLAALGSDESCMNRDVEVACPVPPTGPGGETVDDRFTFVHQALTGDGEITARVHGMTGTITYPPPNHDQIVPGLVPWAKAGIMVKASTQPGSAYASVLLTGHHGVRMQADFTHDVAAPGYSGEVWLRLKRVGDTVTGYASADGTAWRRIDTVKLAGLPRTVQIGLFAASPSDITKRATAHGGHLVQARFTQASANFSQVSPAGGWTYDSVGGEGALTDWEKTHPPGLKESAGVLTVTGSGDIAPRGLGDGQPIEHALSGLFLALLLVIVVAVLFVTAEFRRGLIRTTLIAAPGRGRVVAAKAVVIGGVTFAAGLVAAGVTIPLVTWLMGSRQVHVLSVPWWTELRLVAGAAALLSLTAVFAYAMGAAFRRGVPALVAAVVLLVVPPLLATSSVLPDGAVLWLARITPAAAFAVLQSIPAYPQVSHPYGPADGYYPLAPWAGLGVLLLYVAAALAVAVLRMRRADA